MRRLSPLEALEVGAMSLWQRIKGVLPPRTTRQRAGYVLSISQVIAYKLIRPGSLFKLAMETARTAC